MTLTDQELCEVLAHVVYVKGWLKVSGFYSLRPGETLNEPLSLGLHQEIQDEVLRRVGEDPYITVNTPPGMTRWATFTRIAVDWRSLIK